MSTPRKADDTDKGIAASDAPPRVAFQGVAGAFSEEAARTFFPGRPIATLPCPEFDDVAAAVLSGTADYGVLPAENSIHGGVTGSYDVLAAGELTVIGEVVRPIRLCLLGVAGSERGGIRRVLSHPVALAQCRRFLAGLMDVEAIAVQDTAGAAKHVAMLGDPGVAAVASRTAAERYELAILAESIEDRPDNQTRFFLVAATRAPESRTAGPSSGRRAIFMIEAPHRPGSLVAVLAPFARHGINLTNIQSRPAERAWSYRFFLELLAPNDGRLADALREVEREAERVVALGVFDESREEQRM